MHEPDDLAPLGDDELAELRSLVERANLDDIEWETVTPDMWNRIADTVDVGPDRALTSVPTAAPAPSAITPRRGWWLAAAGVAAAAAAAVAVVVIVNDDDPDTEVVAAIDLETLAGSGSGRAELVRTADTLHLRVATEGLAAPDGYYEVWMIDPSVTALVSLGPLRADGDYDVPVGVDPAAYPIIDVSVEPVDGDPAHSGVSVLRGELPA